MPKQIIFFFKFYVEKLRSNENNIIKISIGGKEKKHLGKMYKKRRFFFLHFSKRYNARK